MLKNIKISYLLAFFFNSIFWLGIWLFFYLRFTNYAGVGIIESFAIFSSTLTEIPTGAVADLLGKKKTLSLAFFMNCLGQLIMGVAPSFIYLIISVLIISLGYSFYSGTFEALLYDSLKEKGQENKFNKIISNIRSITFISSALASIIGGFIYAINPYYPYLLVSIFNLIGLFFTFFLKEPKIDSEIFSFKNYLNQTKQGFVQLFRTDIVKRQSLFLLAIGSFSIIAHETLIDALAINFGFKAQQLGILIATTLLISALISQLTPIITKKYNKFSILFFISILISLLFILTPFLGLIAGGLLLLFWGGIDTIQNNIDIVIVNENTQSKYRATTISTLKMIKLIPYLISAYFIGYIIDLYSAKSFAFVFGILLLTTTLIFRVKKSKTT